MINFRTRTDNTLLYSTISVKTMISKVIERNESEAIIVDKGNMFGVVAFYKKCLDSNIKPIIGLEVMVHNGESLLDRDKESYPLILIAKNKKGYDQLMFLSSISFTTGFYREPRINLNTLKSHSSDLIVMDPLMDGKISTIDKQDISKYIEENEIIFTQFAVGIPVYKAFNTPMLQRLEEINKTEILTLPAQEQVFVDKNDEEEREILRIIGDSKTDEYNGLIIEKSGEEFHLADEADFSLLLNNDEIIENARNILNTINVELNLGDPTPPMFSDTKMLSNKEGLGDLDDAEYFTSKCKEKLKERLVDVDKKKHQEYWDRLYYEIGIINSMKFPGYMLIVWDFVKAAKEMGIAIGPGRGSAAGSLVAYSLEITDIDPMKYDLLFERFLNPERISMPDIDMDFMQARRGEIINYVVQKYGYNNVAQITTFSTFLPKGEIKDIGKTLGIHYSETDKATKKIPDLIKTMKEAKKTAPELEAVFTQNASWEKLEKTATKLEGLQRNTGIHAAGVVISDNPLWEKTPVYRSEEGDSLVTQYSLNFLEDVDLIKFDFLGLKTLDVIDNAINMINRNYNLSITTKDIDVEDSGIYKLAQEGNTVGLFQIESAGMQSLNKRIQPDQFEDLIAILALYRPGPMESGMLDDFIDRKHGKKAIEYTFPELEPILKPTYGVIVYQEQVMQIVQTIGGFSLGKADIVRRAMGKKKKEEMIKYNKEFSEGAQGLGLDYDKASKLFDLIEKFAGYGFNKSHSAAYAMITAQTAWLKAYYPAEFMAALMTSVHESPTKLPIYLDHAKKLGIEIIPPSVNTTIDSFEAIKGRIYYGLRMIKGIGHKVVRTIIESCPDGGYVTIEDLLLKTNKDLLKKDTMEFLINSGALDEFTYSRRRLFLQVPDILKSVQTYKNIKTEFDLSLFHGNQEYIDFDFELNQGEEWGVEERYMNEVGAIGTSIGTEDPLSFFKPQNIYANMIEEEQSKGKINTYVNKVESKTSKKGNVFYILHLSDSTSKFSGIIFGSNIQPYLDSTEDKQKSPWLVKIEISDSGSVNIKEMTSLYDDNAKKRKTEKEIVVIFSENEELNKKLKDSAIEENGSKRLILLNKKEGTSQYVVEPTNILVTDAYLKKHKEFLATKQYRKVKKIISDHKL